MIHKHIEISTSQFKDILETDIKGGPHSNTKLIYPKYDRTFVIQTYSDEKRHSIGTNVYFGNYAVAKTITRIDEDGYVKIRLTRDLTDVFTSRVRERRGQLNLENFKEAVENTVGAKYIGEIADETDFFRPVYFCVYRYFEEIHCEELC